MEIVITVIPCDIPQILFWQKWSVLLVSHNTIILKFQKKANITQVLTSVYHGLCFLNTKYLHFYVYAIVKMIQFISYHCHIDSNFLPPFLPPSFPLEHGCCDSWWRRRYMVPSGMFSVLHDLLYASCQKCIYWKLFLQSNEYISRYAFM